MMSHAPCMAACWSHALNIFYVPCRSSPSLPCHRRDQNIHTKLCGAPSYPHILWRNLSCGKNWAAPSKTETWRCRGASSNISVWLIYLMYTIALYYNTHTTWPHYGVSARDIPPQQALMPISSGHRLSTSGATNICPIITLYWVYITVYQTWYCAIPKSRMSNYVKNSIITSHNHRHGVYGTCQEEMFWAQLQRCGGCSERWTLFFKICLHWHHVCGCGMLWLNFSHSWTYEIWV